MGKASRRKARRKLQRTNESALAERVRHRESGEKLLLIKEPAGLEKMSQVLQDFAGPVLAETSSKEEYREVLAMAVIAWNLSLLPEAAREQKIAQLIRPNLGPEGTALFMGMVARKLAFYPDIQRHILDYELTDMGPGEFHLDVISDIPAADWVPPGGFDAVEAFGERSEGAARPEASQGTKAA